MLIKYLFGKDDHSLNVLMVMGKIYVSIGWESFSKINQVYTIFKLIESFLLLSVKKKKKVTINA